MQILVALLVLCAVPPIALASDPSGLLYIYGALGIVALPHALLTNFAAWFSSENLSYRWVLPLSIAKHLVAFAFCLWYLPRFRRLLRMEHASVT